MHILKKENSIVLLSYVRVGGFLVLSAVLVLSASSHLLAQNTRGLQEESTEIYEELQEVRERSDRLDNKADNLEEAIEKLDEEIAHSESEIERINGSIAELQDQLDIAQVELEDKQRLLRANMRILYKQGDASTFELLASSDSFSEYIDEQEYLGRLKSSIQDTTETVYGIRESIRHRQDEQKELLMQQETIKESLNEARAQRERLLDDTKDKSSRLLEYSQNLVQRQREISQELLRMSHVIPTNGNGGYPWANARCAHTDDVEGLCYHPDESDLHFEWYVDDEADRRGKWGYYYRNCTSYVAWRSAKAGFQLDEAGSGRRSLGHGGQWADNAGRYDGLSVSNEPKVNSYAVFNVGGFGHVAFVEEISDSRVRISEYNFSPLGGGEYSERWVPRYQPTAYVHTPISK